MDVFVSSIADHIVLEKGGDYPINISRSAIALTTPFET